MDFEKDVLNYQGKVLVDFYAEWCGPCQALRPILDEAEKELPEGAKILSVDIDAEPAIAERYGVVSIPCLILFKNGEEIDRSVGLMSKKKILKLLGD
ncbi:thioredoxin [Candidatus Saccharibacteria bacterium]|nr:thioredoxin [Candidatus Saccharibacteria bacterium]